jgi:hypothetical protein
MTFLFVKRQVLYSFYDRRFLWLKSNSVTMSYGHVARKPDKPDTHEISMVVLQAEDVLSSVWSLVRHQRPKFPVRIWR